MSDPDFNNTMTRQFFSSFSGRRIGKTLVVSSLLLSLAATFSVQSAIRILGPQDESPSPNAVQPLSQSTQPTSTANRRQAVGPTRDSDTLWSIANNYKPSNAVTVYQTLGAIYRLNPAAFEDNNIHGLIPGSTLLMPTVSEIRRESTDDVAQRLQIDQARKDSLRRVDNRPLSQQVTAPAPQPVQPAPAPVVPAPASVKEAKVEPAKPEPKEAMAEEKAMMPKEEMAKTDSEMMKDGAEMTPPKPDMAAVQNQINESDLQMGKLVESNHILKIRLAEVQNELAALKDQMTADEELTGEIREFLEMQRMRQAQMQMKEPTFMESLIASPLMLATVAIIPALLIIGAAAFFIMRRRKDDDVEEPEGIDSEMPDDMPVIMVPEPGDDTDELILEDDELEVTEDTDADELFGDESLFDSELDDINLSDSLELSEEPEEGGLDLDADTDFGTDTDLAASLDDFDTSTDLDVEASTDGAIGLEDMERALDEMSASPDESELSPDEALAAMWEQSLSGGGDDDVDDIDALLNAEQGAPEEEKESVADVEASESEPDTNEALFDKVLEDEPEVDLTQDIDLSDDDDVSDDNAAMLDDLLGEDVDLIDDDFLNEKEEENLGETDALLDELFDGEQLDEDGNTVEPEAKDDTDDLSLDALQDEDITDTDALLDEFLNDDDADPLDESALLDESIDDDDLLEEVVGQQEDDSEVDLGETDALLDDLLGDGDEDDETALLNDVEDEDLLGEDLLSLEDDILSEEPAETSADADFDDLLGEETQQAELDDLESLLEEADSELQSEPEAEDIANLDELDDISLDDDMAELESLIDEAPTNEIEEPEASDDDMALLDEALESDEELSPESSMEDVQDISASEESDDVADDNVDASNEELDLLDSLLDEQADDSDALEQAVESVAESEGDLAEAEQPEVAEDIADDLAAFVDEPTADSAELDIPDAEESPEGVSAETEAAEESPAVEADAADEIEDEILEQPEPEDAFEPEAAVDDIEHAEEPVAEVEASDTDTPEAEALSEDDSAEDDELLDLSSLPEYDEEAAMADIDLEPAPIEEMDDYEDDGADDEPLDLNNLPEYTEEDAAAEFDVQPENDAQSPEDESETEAFNTDDLADEELAELDTELDAQEANSPELEEEPENVFTATEPNTLAFPKVDAISLDDLGEFDEDDALDAAMEEQRELEEGIPESERSRFTQETPPQSAGFRAAELDDIADLEDDAHQVAGLNMDALLSEPLEDEQLGLGDFETEELDIPEDESGIWSAEVEPEPELESEDWSEQPEVLGDDIKSMELEADLEGLLEDAESELIEESTSDKNYISIEELMKDDGVEQEDPDSLKMDLDVGLEDFPDVLSDIQHADVDSSGESAMQMDLAKAIWK
ncbi:FimV/HubP family polar landmark protein [Enterovibrio coralii]|uniref:FimV/HubP family polar landmark protein n=1 Tax=Enterovibrio coralii TaxID=294935 RepID=UPI000A7C2BCF|nr:FimV/HubP family polar landmark protein [Enterovibrio coralii]